VAWSAASLSDAEEEGDDAVVSVGVEVEVVEVEEVMGVVTMPAHKITEELYT
jgi:hypothetical protein